MKKQFHIKINSEEPIVIDINNDESISFDVSHPPTQFDKKDGGGYKPFYKIDGLRWRNNEHFHLGWTDKELKLNDKITIQYIESNEKISSLTKEEKYIEPELTCSFCNKKVSEVQQIIDGGLIACICNECVLVCQSEIDKDNLNQKNNSTDEKKKNHILLLGDSIFDNAGYVGSGESVIEQLQTNIPVDSKATLLAVDGDITSDVYAQLELIPEGVTHAFLSIGGNDALRIVNVLQQSVSTVGEAMEIFTEIRLDFQNSYRKLITQIKQKVDKLIICTVHDSVPDFEPRALTALSMFNEIILKEAFAINASVIDLRLLCNEKEDYSTISPIEPSGQGARKIVEQIVKVTNEHGFNIKTPVIYE
ncbi:hypothetical protein MNBD_GAMMA03-923 [hydrothermal vent metagenome]|uniref:ClpX-type ZB domain-containing protein n=1 Tax=hydrothermal vent metagenome TaxID=652676 RepID=A0A3B0W0Y3_9ZZZZ